MGTGVWSFGVDGIAVGRDLECKEVECEGDEQEEAEKCGGEGEAGEMVLLTELRADEEGVVWLGEDEERVVLIHGKKAGVMLRGEALEKRVEGGQQKWFGKRVVAVVGLRLASVYQLSWGADEEGMERRRLDLERQVAMGNREKIVIGGDFNASIGRGGERRGVCGKYGLGRGNEAGRDLVDWCEEMGMAHVNSFMRYKRRGT